MRQVHPFAKLLPELSEADMEALIASIREHGLLVPILLHEDQIIDGRSRYYACNEIGVTPRFEVWQGPAEPQEMLEAVLSMNVSSRRQLTQGQRIAIAGRAAELLSTYDPKAARRSAARICGLKDEKFVQLALEIRESKPDLYESMLSGEVDSKEAMKDFKSYRLQQADPAEEKTGPAGSPDEPKPIKAPKLQVPSEARFCIVFYGETQDQVTDLMNLALNDGRRHMLAQLTEGKWITEVAR